VAKSKKTQAAQTGSQSANFHKGTRSEYLAHYVFSSFGTSVPVPHPEDTGIDLHCTLIETIGQRIWPVEYYMVQVKSTDEPWLFSSKQSVEQLYKLPSPVFFCIATKKELRLRVYSTLNRLSVLHEMPSELHLFPGDTHKGVPRAHDATNRISLGDPILNFTMSQIVDDRFAASAKQILRRAIREDANQSFLRRLGVPTFTTTSHTTNKVEPSGSRGIARLKQSPEQKGTFDYVLGIMLSYLDRSIMWDQDVRGHWRLGLLRRHLETKGSAGKLRKGGPLYKTILAYLREKRKADEDASMSDNLDAMFDGIVQALIEEHLEHRNKVHQKCMEDGEVEVIW
jgi:hypothetical protein